MRPLRRVVLRVRAALAAVAMLGVATQAEAATRVALLGPSNSSVLARLQRNVTSLKLETSPATVSLCSRDVVQRLVEELGADRAICTDGDQIALWAKDHGRLVLKDSIVVGDQGDRGQELAAARAVVALQALDAPGKAQAIARTFTFVVSGDTGRAEPVASAPPPTPSAPPEKDSPAPPAAPTPAMERYAPRVLLSAGPAVAASRDGSSVAISAQAEIGVGRRVAVVPWMQIVPANRTVVRAAGTAEFRPTIFGFGFNVPLSPTSSIVVPRIGAGYGILWMHVAPESALAPARSRSPEDLVAPIAYGTFALSFRLTPTARVAAEGMLGSSTNDMVVRIAGSDAAHWGVPLASLALRGEWVIP